MLEFSSTQIGQVKEINNSPTMIYLSVTGGGHSFFHHFMAISGASKTIAGGNIPYSKEHMIDFCEKSINKFCCADTALLLATKSYTKGLLASCDMIGIGIVSSLSYDGERIGRKHFSYVAFHTREFSLSCEIEFNSNTTREEQEFTISEVLLQLLYNAVNSQLDVEIQHTNALINISYVNRSEFSELDLIPDTEDLVVLYPGSFNPYHDGHYDIAKLSEQTLNAKVIHEIATTNADKGVLNYFDIKSRIKSIKDRNPDALVLISDEPTFVGKVKPLKRDNRKIVVVLGSDTWERLSQSKYGYDINQLINWFTESNTSFLVFNRAGHPYTYQHNPNNLVDMNNLLIQNEEAFKFNNPTSSTNLRILNEGDV